MYFKRSKKGYGSEIIHVGPLCIKYYRPHKRLPKISAIDRLKREIVGGKILRSSHIIVAQPWIWSKSGLFVIRRWYKGNHPLITHQLRECDVLAFANWISEHRGKGDLFPFETNRNLAILTHLSMRGIHITDPLSKAILEGKDILHADLVPENILFGNNKPVVLDSESLSIGHLAWDIAQLIFYIFSLNENDSIAQKFLKAIELNRVETELVWNIVNLFAKNNIQTICE